MEDGIKETPVVVTFSGRGMLGDAVSEAEDEANNHLRDHRVAHIQSMTTQTIHCGVDDWVHIITICW